MDEKTLTALQGSIAKWEAISKGDGWDRGSDNCPLCQVFFANDDVNAGDWTFDGCMGCPVAEHAQMSCCQGTPYERWAEYAWDHRKDAGEEVGGAWHYRAFDEKSKQLAKAEMDFLKSLLPRER